VTVTVYRARRDDAAVITDWLIVGSLTQLEEAMADGWHVSEEKALAALAPLQSEPNAAEPVYAPDDAPEPADDPEPDEPASAPTTRTAKKKR
jgi:hypothetical protein